MMGRGRMVEAAEGREGGGRERGGGEEAGRGGRQRGVPPKNRKKTEKKQPVFCLFFVCFLYVFFLFFVCLFSVFFEKS